MEETLAEDVYLTLQGQCLQGNGVPGVENLFEIRAECALLYEELYVAYQRLCDRLGVVDEDADVEIIISNLMSIERIVSKKMFEYGWKFELEQQEAVVSGDQ